MSARLDDLTVKQGADGAAMACTAEQTVLGEGVRWDGRRDELLRVDILAGRVHRDRVKDDGSLAPSGSTRCLGPLVRSLRSRATRGGCSPRIGGSST